MLIAETYRLLREALAVPEDFDIVLLPGSIRQALVSVIRATMPDQGRSVSVVSGYWGGFMADACHAVSPQAVSARPEELQNLPTTGPSGPIGLVTISDMETETGLMPDDATRAWVAQVRAGGALVIADAACTAPIHPVDYGATDIVVLGSHKCLGAPAGLGILLLRHTVALRPDWGIDAFRRDAVHKQDFVRGYTESPSHQPPLPTLPIEIVAALSAALRSIVGERSPLERARTAADELRKGCAEVGLAVPYGGQFGGSTVTRIAVPPAIGSERLRIGLADRGYFVIGGIGNSADTSFIRVGTMSAPQCATANVQAFLGALDDACRTAGDVR